MFEFTVYNSITQKEIDRLISLYQNCESVENGVVDTTTGEQFNLIQIEFIPNDPDLFAEVDTMFLGYLVLYLNKFANVKAIFKIQNQYIDKIRNNFSENDYKQSIEISGRAFSLFDQLYFVQRFDSLRGRISLDAEYYEKEGNTIKKVLKKTTISKRFFPIILLRNKSDYDDFFIKSIKTNEQTRDIDYYHNLIEKTKKYIDLNNDDFSIIQIYLLSLLLSDDNPKSKKLTKDYIEYCIDYSKQLSSGLNELALNIVEHSKDNKNSEAGGGIITGRLFETKRLKVLKGDYEKSYLSKFDSNEFHLDINVIDLGYQSVRQKYIDNIKNNKAKDIDNRFKIEYDKDIEVIESLSEFQFRDFYFPNTKTDHQLNKLISRYGLQYFTHILSQRFDAYIKAISHNESVIIKGIREESPISEEYRYGTSYNCIVPFSTFNKFYKITKESEDNKGTGLSEDTISDITQYEEVELRKTENYDNYKIIEIELDINEGDDKYEKLKKVYYQFLETKQEIRNNIYLINAFNRYNLSPSDWTRLLSVLGLEFHNIIVKHIDKEITKKIVDVRRASSENSNIDFWIENSYVLFYSYQKRSVDTYGRYGATMLTGKKEGQFKYINFNIWKNHYSFYKGFINNSIDSESFTPDSPFFSNCHLKYFDVILKMPDDDKGQLTLFEHSLRYALNKDLPKNLISKTNNKGYKISNTHFRLGSKIHISSFYYAKRVFQNSFFTTPLAVLITKYIKKQIVSKEYKLVTNSKISKGDINNNYGITLVGYDSYSDFLVSTARNLLAKELGSKYKVSHCSISNEVLSRPLSSLQENIVIIVPIASSFSTSIKIKNELEAMFARNDETKNKNFNFLEPNINLILVGDIKFEDAVETSKDKDEFQNFTKDILIHYGWKSLNIEKKLVKLDRFSTIDIETEDDNTILQKYFIPVYAEWQEAKNCNLCFHTDTKKERCLVETGRASVTPNLIFGFPKTKANKNPNNILDLEGSLLYGNLKKGKNKYLYYWRVGEIINKKDENSSKNNLIKIKEWLTDLNKYFNSPDFSNKKIVLVTPTTGNKSNFLDLVNKIVFGNTANCLSISLKEDYIENSESLYADGLNKADIVIYVDDVLSTVNSFLETNYIIKYIRKKLGNGKGIDYCLTLINRMSFDCEENLLLKLTSLNGEIKNNLKNAPKNLLYFTKINNPSIEEPNNEFPLKKEKDRYKNLYKTSSLDSTRSIFFNKQDKLKNIDLGVGINENVLNKIDDRIGYNNKKLFQLLVLDKLYSIFEYNVDKETDKERQKRLNKCFKTKDDNPLVTFDELREIIVTEFYVNDKFKVNEKHKVHEKVLLQYRHNSDFVILKIICSTPLVYYKDIRESAFKWILVHLQKLIEGNADLNYIGISNLNEENLLDYFKVNSKKYYSEYQTLKFLLKRSVQLKSNFIIHQDFFHAVKTIINLLNEKYKDLEQKKFTKDNLLKKSIQDLFESDYLPGRLELYNYCVGLYNSGLLLKDIFEELTKDRDVKKLTDDTKSYHGNLFDDAKNKFIDDFNKIKECDKYRLTTSKKLIYDFIALIQELIYEHETKAIKLDETINVLIEAPTNVNGDFNHYLRLLKLENTAAIENFWEYFRDKEKDNTNKIKVGSIDIKKYRTDPKFKSIIDLVKVDEDNLTHFTNYLKLKSELLNWEQSEEVNSLLVSKPSKTNISNNNDEFSKIDTQVTTILKITTEIIGKDEVSEAYLSINRNHKIPTVYASDLFFFSPYNPNETDTTKISYIRNSDIEYSLTLNMYNGIKENGYEKYAISNFEFIKNSEGIEYRDNTNIDSSFVKKSWEISRIKDEGNVLLIRLSDLLDQNLFITNAVFTFILKNGVRIDEKKHRLLLSLRQSLNQFIKEGLIEKNLSEYIAKKDFQLKKYLLNHSMKGYIDSMTKIYNRNKVNEEDKELYEAIRQAAYSQLDAIDTDNDKVEMRPLSEIKKRLNLLLRNNLFEGKAIVKYEIDDLNTNNEIEIPLFIYNIVLIELVKNIKRYSYSMNRNLTINYSGDKGFSLSNNVDDDAIKNAKSTNDGLYMCQKLCLDLGWKLIWRFEDVEGIENVSKKFLINLNRTKNE